MKKLKKYEFFEISHPCTEFQELIKNLEKLERFDIDPIYNGEFTELNERIEEDGKYVKWEDVEKFLKLDLDEE